MAQILYHCVQEKVTWRFLCWVCEAGGINKTEETFTKGTNKRRHKRHPGQRPRRHDSPGKIQFSLRSGSDWTWGSLDFKRRSWLKGKKTGVIGEATNSFLPCHPSRQYLPSEKVLDSSWRMTTEQSVPPLYRIKRYSCFLPYLSSLILSTLLFPLSPLFFFPFLPPLSSSP